MLRIQLLISMISLFERIQLLFISIRRLPPNRANRVVLFEGNPIPYYRCSILRASIDNDTMYIVFQSKN